VAEGLKFAKNSSLGVAFHRNGLGNVFGHEILYDCEGIIVSRVLKLFQNLNVDILFGYVLGLIFDVI